MRKQSPVSKGIPVDDQVYKTPKSVKPKEQSQKQTSTIGRFFSSKSKDKQNADDSNAKGGK